MALYLVSTPIGNLEDMTYRAVRVLTSADVILAEDTRRTGILLKHYAIPKKRLESFHDFNKEKKAPLVLSLLKDGQAVALVTDSGTPCISDPGFYLCRECVRAGIVVVPVPGASAVLASLVASGLATDSFSFLGFIPKKGKKKKDFVVGITGRGETAVFFDSPHRVADTVALLAELMPSAQVVVARELTKRFEEFIRGTAAEVCASVKGREMKGEVAVLVKK